MLSDAWFWDLKIKFWGLEIKKLIFYWKITSFSKTMSLQREPFLTVFYTINNSPLIPIVSSAFKSYLSMTVTNDLDWIWTIVPWCRENKMGIFTLALFWNDLSKWSEILKIVEQKDMCWVGLWSNLTKLPLVDTFTYGHHKDFKSFIYPKMHKTVTTYFVVIF